MSSTTSFNSEVIELLAADVKKMCSGCTDKPFKDFEKIAPMTCLGNCKNLKNKIGKIKRTFAEMKRPLS